MGHQGHLAPFLGLEYKTGYYRLVAALALT
jgi:hypothetical protein